MPIPPIEPDDANVAAELAGGELKAQCERCRQLALAMLAEVPRTLSRERRDVFVTVVVHERHGEGRGLAASCVTGPELERLGRVLGEAAGDVAELAVEVAEQGSPWK